MGNEAVVEVDETQEFSEFGESWWLGEITDSTDLSCKWLHSVAVNMMSKEFQRVRGKLTFRGVDDHAILVQAVKQKTKMRFMLIGIVTGN